MIGQMFPSAAMKVPLMERGPSDKMCDAGGLPEHGLSPQCGFVAFATRCPNLDPNPTWIASFRPRSNGAIRRYVQRGLVRREIVHDPAIAPFGDAWQRLS